MNEQNRTTFPVVVPAIAGTVLGLVILWTGEMDMQIAQWVSIIVALVGVVGTLIACSLQLKRDGKSIDNILATSHTVDKTTASMLTTVSEMRSTQKEQCARDASMQKELDSIQQRNEKIDFIHSELEYYKRQKMEMSRAAASQDVVLAQIGAVFDENARLAARYKDEYEKVQKLTLERDYYKKKCRQLEITLYGHPRTIDEETESRDMSLGL